MGEGGKEVTVRIVQYVFWNVCRSVILSIVFGSAWFRVWTGHMEATLLGPAFDSQNLLAAHIYTLAQRRGVLHKSSRHAAHAGHSLSLSQVSR